jgi:bifunctional non-homologous end joining protein LigD
MLGVYERADLIYVGHTGTGFNERELSRVMKLLKPIETTECPFRMRPSANEKPHWVKPTLVAQVRFTEWTADGKLRQPVYLGLRDDKDPREVVREKQEPGTAAAGTVEPRTPRPEPGTRNVLDQLQSLEDAGRDGTIDLPDGSRLAVTNLRKIFWPRQTFTKGDLFRYYVKVAPFILPAVADRPLVMKRFPNGIAAKPFYQHRAESPPKGVRIEDVTVDQTRPQIIGGSLTTLLYMAQLAAISQDPWFSRVQSPEFADYAALDLDPPAGVPFDRVLDVARWIRDELGLLGVEGFPKTSGADGLHIYVRLPPKTPYEAGQIFCQIIATVVAQKHSKAATVERSVAARGQRVYIDYLQNILGKTLATAYSARASEYAGVSTPLTWKEIDSGVRREAFTIETLPDRVKRVGDLWAPLMKSKGIDLSKIARYAERTGGAEPPAEKRPGLKRPGRLR